MRFLGALNVGLGLSFSPGQPLAAHPVYGNAGEIPEGPGDPNYDADTQTSFPVLNPDFGQPSRTNLAQLQTPRQSIPSSNRFRRVFLV